LRLDGQDRGVEALQVAGLDDEAAFAASARPCNPDQIVGLGEARGEGLFDQHVEACIEQGRGYGMMMDGGHGDGGCVETKIGGEQFIDRGEDRDCIFSRGVGGTARIRLDGCDQSNAQAGGFQLAVDAEMVTAEGAGTGNGDTESG